MPNRLLNRDTLGGVVLLAIAALYYWATQSIAESTLSDDVGASGLPRALTIILAMLASLMIARALLARSSKAETGASGGAEDLDATPRRGLAFLLFGAAYVAILPFAGYFISVALLIAAIAIFEGAPRRWTVPAAALIGATLYWAIFVRVLGVRQPMGWLLEKLIQ